MVSSTEARFVDLVAFLDYLFATENHLILRRIFLHCDPRTLHSAQQVNKQWNKYLREEVWRSPSCQPALRGKLSHYWKFGFPCRQPDLLRCSSTVSDVEVDKRHFVFGLMDGRVEVWDAKSHQLLATMGK